MTTRNSALLEEFVEYCKAHPEERFWQALRNWSEQNYIMAVDVNAHTKDTFHWEGKKE